METRVRGQRPLHAPMVVWPSASEASPAADVWPRLSRGAGGGGAFASPARLILACRVAGGAQDGLQSEPVHRHCPDLASAAVAEDQPDVCFQIVHGIAPMVVARCSGCDPSLRFSAREWPPKPPRAGGLNATGGRAGPGVHLRARGGPAGQTRPQWGPRISRVGCVRGISSSVRCGRQVEIRGPPARRGSEGGWQ